MNISQENEKLNLINNLYDNNFILFEDINIITKIDGLIEKNSNKIKDSLVLKDNIDLFIIYSIIFRNQAKINYKTKNVYYCGMDFEYESKKIALWQICFYSDKKYIWLIDPKSINDKNKPLIIKYVFTSKYIYRILHGSDSIDIPYLYYEFFKNDYNTIIKFTHKLIDTRFLCEFDKILSKQQNKKCSIYDAALYYDVISKSEYDNLNLMADKMGIIYRIKWNLEKLSYYQYLYALYDVFYLKTLTNNIYFKNKYPSLDYIPELTRHVFLEKFNVEEFSKNMLIAYSELNNYYVKYKNEFVNASYFFDKINLSTLNIYIFDFLEINYFKSTLNVLFKFIFLCLLQKKQDIYINKKEIYNKKFDESIFYDHFTKLKMKKIIKLSDIIAVSLEKYLNS